MNAKSIPEMREFLRRMGISQDMLHGLNVIHVAGTKGKGSTCSYTERILRNAGLKTGLFTSPHLVQVRERIRINGVPISEPLFVRYLQETWDKLSDIDLIGGEESTNRMPTYFRFLTLMAFHAFLQEKVDVAVIEVGIGGLFDATNVIDRPIVCAITSLGLDHVKLLGNSLTLIARHKAGIMKVCLLWETP
jgi:folylpolyglutamate synthase